MPVKVSLRNGKYRIVEASSGNIASTEHGTARDGGGHETEAKAIRQARVINQAVREKGK